LLSAQRQAGQMENNPILLKFRESNKGLENDDSHVTAEKILSEEGFVSNIDPQGKGSQQLTRNVY